MVLLWCRYPACGWNLTNYLGRLNEAACKFHATHTLFAHSILRKTPPRFLNDAEFAVCALRFLFAYYIQWNQECLEGSLWLLIYQKQRR